MGHEEKTREQLIEEIKLLRGHVTELKKAESERKKAEEELYDENETLNRILESAPVPILTLDLEGKVGSVWNPAAERILGWSKDEVLGKPYPVIPPGKEEEFAKNVKKTISGEGLKGVEVHRKRRDGTTIDYNIYAASMHDKRGVVTGLIAVLLDITKRKKIEKALAESENKLDSMLQSIGDHISMMDKDLNILWANKVARKIFGDDIIGKKCYETYHRRKEPCEPYPCITLKAFQDGRVHEHDTQVAGKDGKTIDYHCTANVALKDEEGKPTAVMEISRDITERKRAEQDLSKKVYDLERFHKVAVGRELRMKELKKEIEKLRARSNEKSAGGGEDE